MTVFLVIILIEGDAMVLMMMLAAELAAVEKVVEVTWKRYEMMLYGNLVKLMMLFLLPVLLFHPGRERMVANLRRALPQPLQSYL